MSTHGVNYFSAEKKSASKISGTVPKEFLMLSLFNKSTNKYGKYKGLAGQPVDEEEIYVMEFKGKILLWWKDPAMQIDDFVYTGDRQKDIDECNIALRKSGLNLDARYTWHHTGYPTLQTHGTMQLVPTEEHACLPHIGGVAISKGQYD